MHGEIDLKELSILADMALPQLSATLKEQEGGFVLMISRRGQEPSVLVSQRKSVRIFKRLDTAAGFLRDLGIVRFNCDLVEREVVVS